MNNNFASALLLIANIFLLDDVSARSSRASSILDQFKDDSKFMNFASRNNKHYTNMDEFVNRQNVYHDNIQKINANNRKNRGNVDDLVLGENEMTDWTQEEYLARLNMPQDYSGLEKSLPWTDSHNLNVWHFGGRRDLQDSSSPIQVNHYADGFMHPVKDQHSCGACWAFAANSAAEGTLAKKMGTSPIHMSEQQMVDCTLRASEGGTPYDRDGDSLGPKDYGGKGCSGAWMWEAWEFQKDHGVMLEEDYPYESGRTGQEYTCRHDMSKVMGYISHWERMSSVAHMKSVVEQQPVTATINASTSAFQFYQRGVVKPSDNCSGDRLNHAVVIVGFDEGCQENCETIINPEGNHAATDCVATKWWHRCPQRRRLSSDLHLPHWIVLNSWGDHYGDQGFIRMQITEGDGVCGINKIVNSVEWRDKY